MAKASPVNPFAAASQKPTATSKPKSQVIIADSVFDQTGAIIYGKQAVVDAMDQFASGAAKIDEAKTLMGTAEPIITAFGLQAYVTDWLSREARPENPKLTSLADGTGPLINFTVQNRQINMAEPEIAALASIIGAAAAKDSVEERDEFTLISDTLDKSVTAKDKAGKPVNQTVMKHMIEALQERFADSPEILANLFTVKPTSKTKPDLILKLLSFLGARRNSKDARFVLQNLIRTIKAPIGLKVTGK